MNIGKWIVVAFVLFTAFIATLVTVCMRQDISLVSKDYYKEELGYEQQMIRQANTSALAEKPVIKLINGVMRIEYNDFHKIQTGELKLFCPSNDKMDRSYKLNTTQDNVQSFRLDELKKGMYKARLSWSINGKQFYQEEIIYL